jgi:hypothetical protein
MQPGEQKETPAPIFSPSSRAELWSAGTAAPESEPELELPMPVEH